MTYPDLIGTEPFGMNQKNETEQYGVLIIDMQEKFIKDHKDYSIQEKISSQQRLLNACTVLDLPVAVLEYESNGETIPQITDYALKVPKNKFIIKIWDDGFHKTDLAHLLAEWGVNHLILAGINSGVCVKETARGWRDSGFGRFSTARDLIADYRDEDGRMPIYIQNWYSTYSTNFFATTSKVIDLLKGSKRVLSTTPVADSNNVSCCRV